MLSPANPHQMSGSSILDQREAVQSKSGQQTNDCCNPVLKQHVHEIDRTSLISFLRCVKCEGRQLQKLVLYII